MLKAVRELSMATANRLRERFIALRGAKVKVEPEDWKCPLCGGPVKVQKSRARQGRTLSHGEVSLSVPGSGGKTKTLLKTPGAADPVSLHRVALGPYGVYIGEVR